MKTIDLKRQEIIQFIMQVQDESLLDKVKTLFVPTQKESKDWWDELSDEDKEDIQISLKEIEEGRVVPHAEVDAKVKAMIDARRK